MKKFLSIISLAIAFVSCSPVQQDADIGVLVEPIEYFVKPSQTIDGDTIIVTEIEDITKEITVNLCGIDAPELDESGGTEARQALAELLKQTEPNYIVSLVARDDFSGNEYDHAEVFYLGSVDGEEQDIFVNAEMIRLGHAVVDDETLEECLNGYLLEESQ